MGYTIGQFAGLHQVSKKQLRYYKEIGLLEPAGVDPANGYTCYEDEQSKRLERIQYLRRLRFSLEEIRALLLVESDLWIEPIQAQLASIQRETCNLIAIEFELLDLQKRISEGKEVYASMTITTEYKVDTFDLEEPIHIIGRAARVPYSNSNEKQALIDQLISSFFGNDEPEMIPNRMMQAAGIGLVCECEQDMSWGTYMMGMQVTSLDEIPEGMRSFTLPAGLYVRVAFRASNRETLTNSALAGAYDFLYNNWLPESGFCLGGMLAAEVYVEDRMEFPVYPEMELWQLLEHNQ
ncbi:MerR family transcriptional regulator [Paenibacillus tianjinensis]|uniref:MerR family transcriptional regulator n=1 Tax=Paenibacillus tianjinensis TaxID=2810347 RepID=A0ABX7LJ29_9BACL|nr:MerR family transcriptional regulator [Paenibacillus tianjinensis]QSF47358.1 MerR family transcriptional regulator [Paenibacillus tianjinensis]